jgi:hypothetical protein
MVKEIKSAKVETLIACIVALAMVLGSACTREPNHEDGIIEMKAATGVVAVSPGDLEKIKEKIPAGGSGVSRSYLKANGKETVRVSGSESNTAVFLSGSTLETADFRIKGSRKFVEKTISTVQEITGVSLSISHLKLIAETRTYAGFQETNLPLLEEELGKTMTSLSRSKSSFNGWATIKSAFGNGLQEVRLKYSKEYSALRITIEGDKDFVDGVKALIDKAKKSDA